MFLDLSPLRPHRGFRYLFAGQCVSALASFFVARLAQICGLTTSSTVVGFLGAAERVPLAATALWGGALRMQRIDVDCPASLLGNARAGCMAERFGGARSMTWGGLLCVAGVSGYVPVLPAFWPCQK